MSEDDRRPIPDPTVLTTAALEREIRSLRELLEARLTSLNERVTALVVARSEVDHERFASVDLRFKERDIRFDKSAKDHQIAIDLALSSSVRQIEQMTSALTALTKSFDERVNDMKDRLISMEAGKDGVGKALGWIIAAAGLVIASGIALVSHFGISTH